MMMACPADVAGKQVAPAVLVTPGGRTNLFGRFVMLIVANGSVGFFHNPALEALELRDIGARDLTPTLGSAITWEDVDRMAERAAACPPGYVDAMCLGCGAAVFVPASNR